MHDIDGVIGCTGLKLFDEEAEAEDEAEDKAANEAGGSRLATLPGSRSWKVCKMLSVCSHAWRLARCLR